jgi:hypothetical protein
MLWRIDAGDYAGGLDCRACAAHGWVMPQALGRNVQTVAGRRAGRRRQAAQRMKAEFPADVLLQTLD